MAIFTTEKYILTALEKNTMAISNRLQLDTYIKQIINPKDVAQSTPVLL